VDKNKCHRVSNSKHILRIFSFPFNTENDTNIEMFHTKFVNLFVANSYKRLTYQVTIAQN